MVAIVISRSDEASVHIGEQLLDLVDWETETDESRPEALGGGTVYRTDGITLREFDPLHLELENVADAFAEPELLVFASRHAGETGELLTAHHTGNFGVAEFGGDAGHFARACPNAHRAVIHALTDHAPNGYEVGMECTHHGPTDVDVPSMFVEIGSGKQQWEDADAARAVARSILELRDIPPDSPPENGTRRHLLGFGGGHYAPRFERVIRESDWTVGHIAADWSLDALEEWAESDADHEAVLKRAFTASAADYALLEADRPALEATIESLGYRVVGETFVRETTGVPLSLVEALEAAVDSIAAGLRFGERASDYEGPWTVTDLPADLLDEARGIDSDTVRKTVERQTLAFTTEQNGTVVTGPVVLANDTDREAIVSVLVDILRQQYDSVERDGDELVVSETAFDPDLARTAGIPEGPKFGKLSAGQSVEVDGEEISPERFHRERIRRFTL